MDTALSEIIRFRKQGVSFKRIADALNAADFKSPHGRDWNYESVKAAYRRSQDPETIVQRIDSAAGRLQLSLELLKRVAESGGPRAEEARQALDVFEAARNDGHDLETAAKKSKEAVQKMRQGE